jgi:hypothetical protein
VLGIRKDTPDQWAPSLTAQMPGLVAGYARRLNLRTADIPVLMPLSLANWFHLQWSDGRAEFAARMYQSIRHYFEHPAAWNKIFGI